MSEVDAFDGAAGVTNGSITLGRLGGPRDRAVAYKVLVDGAEAARLAEGESVTVPVAAGRHRLELKTAWAYSNAVWFDPSIETDRVFVCRSGLSTFTGAFDSVGRRHRYITLAAAADQEQLEQGWDDAGRRFALLGATFVVALLVLLPVCIAARVPAPLGAGLVTGVVMGTLLLLFIVPLPTRRRRSARGDGRGRRPNQGRS